MDARKQMCIRKDAESSGIQPRSCRQHAAHTGKLEALLRNSIGVCLKKKKKKTTKLLIRICIFLFLFPFESQFLAELKSSPDTGFLFMPESFMRREAASHCDGGFSGLELCAGEPKLLRRGSQAKSKSFNAWARPVAHEDSVCTLT